jgi:hypothetical protein
MGFSDRGGRAATPHKTQGSATLMRPVMANAQQGEPHTRKVFLCTQDATPLAEWNQWTALLPLALSTKSWVVATFKWSSLDSYLPTTGAEVGLESQKNWIGFSPPGPPYSFLHLPVLVLGSI